MITTMTPRLVRSHYSTKPCLCLTMDNHNTRSHHVVCSTKCLDRCTCSVPANQEGAWLSLFRLPSDLPFRIVHDPRSLRYAASIVHIINKHPPRFTHPYADISSVAVVSTISSQHLQVRYRKTTTPHFACVNRHIFNPSTRYIGSVHAGTSDTPTLLRS
jgi:hypothetical protein